MRILEVSRYKDNFADHQLPFVTEQGAAIAKVLRDMQNDELSRDKSLNEPHSLNDEPLVDYFLVKGNYVKAVGALKAKIREFKPDIVHAHYGLSAITAELQSEVPVVTTFHNGETHSWYINFITSLMSLRAKHVIYVAQHIREMVYFKAKKFSIIPCGVSLDDCFLMDKADARKQLGWDPNKKYILFGGAFDNLRKNYALLRDAVELLEKENNTENSEENIKENSSKPKMNNPQSLDNDSKLTSPYSAQEQALGQTNDSSIVANTLPDYSEKHDSILESQKNTKNIEIVEMKGLSREECVLRMNACDVFALPTKNEGSPQALKEAMACNCPIVATDVADIKHLLGDLPGHYLLPNKKGNGAWWKGDKNSIDEMVRLLNDALNFRGRTKGRERIVELGYTNELVAKKIVKIYEDIIGK